MTAACRLRTTIAVVFSFAALAACGGGSAQGTGDSPGTLPSTSGPGPTQINEPGGIPAGYTLHWSDEFNVDGLPDPAKWSYDTARNKDGWFNNEKQYYSVNRPENARVDSGNLIIEARKETLRANTDWGGQTYTSARLLSKMSYQYGHVESRAYVTCPRGSWPAIWQLPAAPYNSWPDDGEIDIMEYVGWKSTSWNMSAGTPARSTRASTRAPIIIRSTPRRAS
jgi:beta-glucanase (GH16 family)